MKPSEINDWLGVITNVGVIAGLALVAYEIHQNSIALDRESRISQIEVVDGIRSAWQNWEFAIIENSEVADIWMRGHANQPLTPLEQFRYEQLGRETFRLISQNFRQYSTIDGKPADWAIQQLIDQMEGRPKLRKIFLEQLARPSYVYKDFQERIRELDPPELRLAGDQ